MNRFMTLIISSFFLTAAATVARAGDKLPAFPGAEGFGALSVGGRGGRVIKVTNLNTRGPGSLQAACSAEGPRIVVFDVSGVIPGDVVIEHGRISIMGQTAPGTGVTIEGMLSTRYNSPQAIDDVVVRFLRVRPSGAQGSGGDAIQFSQARRVILDHLSCSWACDGTIDIYSARDVTVQWCSIEESAITGHPEGRHNYGLISGPRGENVSIHHNLFAHHARRCPAIANGPADVRNNVIYNFRDGLSHEGHKPNDRGFNVIGNYYKRGPSDPKIFPFCFRGDVSYYLRDNFVEGVGVIQDPWAEANKLPGLKYDARHGRKAVDEFPVAKVTTHSPAMAYQHVLRRAGCFPRDATTRRIVQEVQTGTGAWGRSGAEQLMHEVSPQQPPRDSDQDGMPDAWEEAHGLDPHDRSDHRRAMNSGYTAIEEYCHELACALMACSLATASDQGGWWNPDWHFRTTVQRSTPWRDDAPRPVEIAIDFPLLMERGNIAGQFDPGSLRVVKRAADGSGHEVPSARRSEFDARTGRQQSYLSWIARPEIGEVSTYDIYFGTKDQHLKAWEYEADLQPPENLLANHGFEDDVDGLPAGWTVAPQELIRLGRFARTSGQRSLAMVVDEKTREDTGREVTIAQSIDVRKFAGQEVVFECDLLAERAAYGAPVSIELEQFRADGSRILEYAVQSRWLTIELAEGQLVQFSERGRLNPEAANVNVKIRMRCTVRDADARQTVTGPESFFTIWLDRVVLRPGERWAWPAETGAGFVEGVLEEAPLNRGFQFTGQRRLAFNGASEGTLTAGRHNPDARSVHWGLEAGTLEFWCHPLWNAEDLGERVFFDSVAYGHRLQSRLRRLLVDGRSHLEFTIADAGGKLRTVRGPARLQTGRVSHVAATWDFPKAHLQLFVDGKLIATEGPYDRQWLSSLVPNDKKKEPGIGISESDRRSMPMQAFIGGDKDCREDRGAEAVLDEFRISDIVRYNGHFTPSRQEFSVDQHTRALFHFENERHGIHDADDCFVRGHLACELPRYREKAPLESLQGGKVTKRTVLVRPHALDKLFEKKRVENRLPVTRPSRRPPDPRFVEYRLRQHQRTITLGDKGTADDEGFLLEVGGDYEPIMGSVTFERAEGSPDKTALLPRWRANDNVVPFSTASLAATLAPDVTDDEEKAFEVMRYALAISNYYDAHFCETLPTRHRSRVSYTLLKAVNIYAFDQCGPLNYTLRKLFLSAGISSNDASGTHHQFQQAFYGGGWRLFDLSPRKYWLNRDNVTVASRRDFEDDLYLKLRQGDGVRSGIRGRVSRARFGSAERPHSMDFALQPAERVSVCWHNEGRWFEITGDRRSIPLGKVPPYFGNGAVVYKPTGRSAGTVMENATFQADGHESVLRAKDPAEPAALIYRTHCPYIVSDAAVYGVGAAEAAGAIKLSLSFDEGKSWTEAWRSARPNGSFRASLLDEVTGRYAYWLKVDLAAGSHASIRGLTVRSTFVASPLALPGKLSRGTNRITFVGGSATVPITTTCRWTERHRSELGVAFNTISYYLNGDEAHRNLLVAAPGDVVPVKVTLAGGPAAPRGEVSLENLPDGWTIQHATKAAGRGSTGSAAAEFVLRPDGAGEGDVEAFDVVVDGSDPPRRVTAQVLVASAPLVREAEQADRTHGKVASVTLVELSGARGMQFRGNGRLVFNLRAPDEGKHALWLRATWEPESSTTMTLALDDGKLRKLRATAMIGFTDWTDPSRAHTKMFAHFGEQYGHWAWYRIPDVTLTASTHQLILGASKGACFDALLLLPQKPVVDRAAMNLLQNWNYSPWCNPL